MVDNAVAVISTDALAPTLTQWLSVPYAPDSLQRFLTFANDNVPNFEKLDSAPAATLKIDSLYRFYLQTHNNLEGPLDKVLDGLRKNGTLFLELLDDALYTADKAISSALPNISSETTANILQQITAVENLLTNDFLYYAIVLMASLAGQAVPMITLAALSKALDNLWDSGVENLKELRAFANELPEDFVLTKTFQSCLVKSSDKSKVAFKVLQTACSKGIFFEIFSLPFQSYFPETYDKMHNNLTNLIAVSSFMHGFVDALAKGDSTNSCPRFKVMLNANYVLSAVASATGYPTEAMTLENALKTPEVMCWVAHHQHFLSGYRAITGVNDEEVMATAADFQIYSAITPFIKNKFAAKVGAVVDIPQIKTLTDSFVDIVMNKVGGYGPITTLTNILTWMYNDITGSGKLLFQLATGNLSDMATYQALKWATASRPIEFPEYAFCTTPSMTTYIYIHKSTFNQEKSELLASGYDIQINPTKIVWITSSSNNVKIARQVRQVLLGNPNADLKQWAKKQNDAVTIEAVDTDELSPEQSAEIFMSNLANCISVDTSPTLLQAILKNISASVVAGTIALAYVERNGYINPRAWLTSALGHGFCAVLFGRGFVQLEAYLEKYHGGKFSPDAKKDLETKRFEYRTGKSVLSNGRYVSGGKANKRDGIQLQFDGLPEGAQYEIKKVWVKPGTQSDGQAQMSDNFGQSYRTPVRITRDPDYREIFAIESDSFTYLDMSKANAFLSNHWAKVKGDMTLFEMRRNLDNLRLFMTNETYPERLPEKITNFAEVVQLYNGGQMPDADTISKIIIDSANFAPGMDGVAIVDPFFFSNHMDEFKGALEAHKRYCQQLSDLYCALRSSELASNGTRRSGDDTISVDNMLLLNTFNREVGDETLAEAFWGLFEDKPWEDTIIDFEGIKTTGLSDARQQAALVSLGAPFEPDLVVVRESILNDRIEHYEKMRKESLQNKRSAKLLNLAKGNEPILAKLKRQIIDGAKLPSEEERTTDGIVTENKEDAEYRLEQLQKDPNPDENAIRQMQKRIEEYKNADGEFLLKQQQESESTPFSVYEILKKLKNAIDSASPFQDDATVSFSKMQ